MGSWVPGVPAWSSLVQPGQSSPQAFGRSIWTGPPPLLLGDDAKQSTPSVLGDDAKQSSLGTLCRRGGGGGRVSR